MAYAITEAAKFLEVEQDWRNEKTRYWFNLDGAEYAVAESGSFVEILDADGKEITDRVEAERLKRILVVTDEMRGI